MECLLVAGVSKPLFVAVYVLVWWASDLFDVLMLTTEWHVYWWNLYHDPCYIDPMFQVSKAQVMLDACNTVNSAHTRWTEAYTVRGATQ